MKITWIRSLRLAWLCCLLPLCSGADFPVLKDGNVTLTGNFVEGGFDPAAIWPDPALKGQPAYGSFGHPATGAGTLTSPVFQAPDELEMYIAGFPSHPGNRIYLRDEQVPGRTLDLVTKMDPGNVWRLRTWELPPEWRGIPVRLVAEDASPGNGFNWFAITLPQRANAGYGFKLLRA